jgi:hypothetical protein
MPCGPCRPLHLRQMLEQPWPGHPEAALTGRADTRSACDACGVVDAVFRREPDQDPDRALDVPGTRRALRVETTHQELDERGAPRGNVVL